MEYFPNFNICNLEYFSNVIGIFVYSSFTHLIYILLEKYSTEEMHRLEKYSIYQEHRLVMSVPWCPLIVRDEVSPELVMKQLQLD